MYEYIDDQRSVAANSMYTYSTMETILLYLAEFLSLKLNVVIFFKHFVHKTGWEDLEGWSWIRLFFSGFGSSTLPPVPYASLPRVLHICTKMWHFIF